MIRMYRLKSNVESTIKLLGENVKLILINEVMLICLH